jgi:prepilin signal peptidase PulO-like enzyme (type II secretory pathway)
VYRISLTATGIMQVNDFLIAISGMAGVVLFFWFLWFITGGKGFGFGDVKLAVPLALLVGWPELLVWVLSSFVLGAVVGLFLIAIKQARFGKPIPFGPFLILGACISLIWGNYLVAWYATLIL